MYQYFKRQLKTPTCSQFVAPGTHTTGPKNHAAKHRLRTQNITSNFTEARSILPEDGSQRIRNMSEFLIVFFKY